MPKLIISGSPHDHTSLTARQCMWQVTLALLPAVAVALWQFGLGAAIVIFTSIAGCLATEWLISRFLLKRQKCSLPDGSAFLTGLLLALNLPSNLPVWIVLTGCVVSIGIGKMAFGGLGCNIFNPALVGRVFLLLSFPAQMTTWPLPGVNRWQYLDAITGPTTLAKLKAAETAMTSASQQQQAIEALTSHDAILDQMLGQVGGSLGEVGAIALIIGFVYLLGRGIITWHIPVSIVAAVALLTWPIAGEEVWTQVLSGGLLLGAIFMATDYVTSPMTRGGMVFYGVMIGIITVVIRQWGAYPEGLSFAILLMNGATPLINRYFKPRRFGEARKEVTA